MIADSAQKAARCDRICAHLVIKAAAGRAEVRQR
jgi:hypothetical protein